MKIAIGSDHAGFELKEILSDHIKNSGHSIEDFGCYGPERADYPDHAHPLAQSVQQGQNERGVVICGSGNGINMTVNKYKGVRSALCWDPELAEMARAHNDANVLALPARYISVEKAMECLVAFLNTPFEGGRHEKRVEKISSNIEQ
ncbi:MAG: Ribose-5-phosphate isomerase B [Flavobacteriia bacterium]|nr:MAG: Ribose-5-phosphate isomerase B [Flavobacteriia bacterium]